MRQREQLSSIVSGLVLVLVHLLSVIQNCQTKLTTIERETTITNKGLTVTDKQCHILVSHWVRYCIKIISVNLIYATLFIISRPQNRMGQLSVLLPYPSLNANHTECKNNAIMCPSVSSVLSAFTTTWHMLLACTVWSVIGGMVLLVVWVSITRNGF